MKTFLRLLARALQAIVVFSVTLVFTLFTGTMLFWAVDSLWVLGYVLGLPLAMALIMDQRYFR